MKERKHTENTHNHNRFLGEQTELYFSIASGVLLGLGFGLSYLASVNEWLPLSCYILAYFFGGVFALKEAAEKIKKGEFEIDFLMIAAAIGAAYIGSWAEGALLLFLFSLGHALEHYAMNKAKKSIEALGELSPKTALLKKGKSLKEVPIEELRINDTIVVKPNTKIAADGVIIKGSSSINQASITGESMPVDKTFIINSEALPDFNDIDAVNIVFTGTINGDSALEVKVLKLSEDSSISRLVKMVSEVETHKSPTQRLTKRFEKWFVPTVIILVITLCFAYLVIDESFNDSLYRAITVLVAASPCALAISTPSAVLSGVARAAKKGVLIKGGRALEDLGSLDTIAFDKTGTLTEGKPKLTHAMALNNYDENTFLQLVLDVESLSNHPLAKAISKDLKQQYSLTETGSASGIKAIQGKGIEAIYNNQSVYIGNTVLMQGHNILVSEAVQQQSNDLLTGGQTVMLVAFNNEIIGLLSVMDVPRDTAKSTLAHLKRIGIKKMVMLTGDHQNVGDAIAKQIGLTEARGNLLPEDKVKAIQELKANNNKVAMVGDGVNDSPAMANSTVGIAMGAAGSDVALETADVALMSDKIESLPFVIALSRASKKIIKQNLWISLGIVAFLVPATLFGFANIGIAVIIHEGSTLLVVINALRLLRFDIK
ncbi:heavy metal translocating P-type ATPase [Bizionia gelidisalsuginis]|uniref:Heavy metal translocating P-type ATPase n=1 Tax=Bizionia gelidisalsuginis TaxID=291188 RepID=A0ABY3M960_9FLAO|nr:heavy metal translocating P-type ATPase [Bizionia gelidisalsuginis]TYC11293.1 heavy metal translocating P-type ATPase [Bizionia gelidisalsuginis]